MPYIYMWKPNLMDQEVGHVSMKLSDGTYISHWPADQKKAFSTVRGDKYTFYDDVDIEGRQPDETLDLPSGMLNEDAIRRWWDQFGGDYNVLVNNCAQVIHRALLVGGADKNSNAILSGLIRSSSSFIPGALGGASDTIITPGDLMRFARRCKANYEGGPASVFANIVGGFF